MTTSRTAPLVSVGMPVYNEERHLDAAIAAVLAQSLRDFELVICDNASTDRTADICRAWAARDARVRYERAASNAGSNRNFNRALEAARGTYFVWASGHDLRAPTFLERCVDILDADPSVVLCYPQAAWLDEEHASDRRIPGLIDTRGRGRLSRFRQTLWKIDYAYPIYGVIRTSALRRTSVMGNTVGADVLLLAELSLLGATARVDEPLLHIRQLPDYGDWSRYVTKALGAGGAARSAWNLYADWLGGYWRGLGRHVHTLPERVVFMTLAAHCVTTKYRFVLNGLRQRTAAL